MSSDSDVPSTPSESRLTPPASVPVPVPVPTSQTLPANRSRPLPFVSSSLPPEATLSFDDETREHTLSNWRQRAGWGVNRARAFQQRIDWHQVFERGATRQMVEQGLSRQMVEQGRGRQMVEQGLSRQMVEQGLSRQMVERGLSDEETQSDDSPAQWRRQVLIEADAARETVEPVRERYRVDDEWVTTLSGLELRRRDQDTLSTRGYEPINDRQDSSVDDSVHSSASGPSTSSNMHAYEEDCDEPNYVWSSPPVEERPYCCKKAKYS